MSSEILSHACIRLQVLRLGAPVTALSLSPAMDILATAHVNRRGIYLWSNSAIYGNAADIRPSTKPLDARLPALSAGPPRLKPGAFSNSLMSLGIFDLVDARLSVYVSVL